MSQTAFGTLTFTATGNNLDVTGVGFNPKWVRFSAGARSGASSFAQSYYGVADQDEFQFAHSSFDDNNGHFRARTHNDCCCFIEEYTGGAWVTRVHIVKVADITDGMRFNVLAADSSWPVGVEFGD